MRWSTLPVSIVIHAAALVLFAVGPFAADLSLPNPWPARVPDYVIASAAPAPIPVEHRRSPLAVSTAAPLHAPDRIAEEDVDRGSAPVADGGLPPDGVVGTGVHGLNIGTVTGPVPPPPPPIESRPQLVRVGGDIREPRKIVGVPAVYPEIARQARIEGLVIIEATIDEHGFVTGARVLRSQPLLDAAALAALKQWRYTPTLLNGVPVRVLMTITFNFKLGNPAP